MSDRQLIALSASEAIEAVKAGELDPAELLEAYRGRAVEHCCDCQAELAKAGAGRKGINCFTWVSDPSPHSPGRKGTQPGARAPGPPQSSPPGSSRDGSPAQGSFAAGSPAGDGRLPLAGVPVAVKDLFCTAGIPSQAGSRILGGYRPPYTATAVERLEAAGAPLLGKANQDEFAMGSSNETSAFGPVLNPWDNSRVPGGSSGGSAAAVAAGLAPWAIGTDTGGSIRQPASLCGIVGMKPTYGAVSRYGMIAFASSLDQAGPLARTVADAALLLSHMIGQDGRDATSLAFPGQVELPSAVRLDGVRLGVAAELGFGDGAGSVGGGGAAGGDGSGGGPGEGGPGEGGLGGGEAGAATIDPGVRVAFEKALALARELGAEIKTVQLPHTPHALAAYYVLAPAECSSNLARFDGVRYGLRVNGGKSLTDMYTQTRHDGFGAEVKRRIMLGTYALSAGYYDAYYGQAQKVRTKIAEDFKAAFQEVDFIFTPTSATAAFRLGERSRDPWSMYMSDYFTVPMSLAGIPAISIPCGLAGDGLGPGGAGLPVGLQLAGPAFSESRLLDAAHALEQAIGFDGSAALL